MIHGKCGRPWRALALAWVFCLLALPGVAAYSASNPLLVLGDSLSAEYGLARGSGWVTLLERKLAADKIDLPVANASVSGETTSGGRSRLPALLERHRPSIVIIELGANDGLRGLSLAATEANLKAMVTAARKAGAQVLLVGMQLPPNYGADYARRFASMFSKVAHEADAGLVPFLLEGIADKPQFFQVDRLHPTAEAQSFMLNNVWPHLKPLLPE